MTTVGSIYRGVVPYWGVETRIWIRILALDAGRAHVRLRLTPELSTTHHTVWVTLAELQFAVTAGVVEAAPQWIDCPICGGRMRLQHGRVRREAAMFWACRQCDEVTEI